MIITSQSQRERRACTSNIQPTGGGAIVQRKQITDLDGEIQKVKLHGLVGAKGLSRTHCEMEMSSMLREGGCACRTCDSNNEIVLRRTLFASIYIKGVHKHGCLDRVKQ